ncbi:MAG TPA: 30S ribosomal protein S20 [Candidatus Paceibacterota bacterium]
MPITSSAKKAVRSAARKRLYNLRRARAVSAAERDIRKLCAAGSAAEAMKLLPAAYKAIDKAAKMGTLKGNTADRKKSRLSGLIKRTGKK